MTTATVQRFILPDLGEGLTEASIVNWLVAVGDTVVIDQPVVEVESAKSVVELPCPYAGVVVELFHQAGDTVHAGQALLSVDSGSGPGPGSGSGGAAAGAGAASDANAGPDADRGSTVDAAASGAAAPSAAGPDTVPGTAVRGDPAEHAESGGSGAVLIGYGTKERKDRGRPAPAGRFGKRTSPVAGAASATPVSATASAAAASTAPTAATAPAQSTAASGSRSPVVSPLVRKLALDHGFDASTLLGSGPGALVLRSDVETAIAGRSGAATAHTAAPATVSGAPAALEGDTRIPLTGIRATIAQRMSASRREVPEATIWLDVDATALLEAKRSLERSTGERWSLNALLARFVVAGLRKYPILNSSLDAAAGEIVQHARINLGLAAQTARGLMVPVVHDAGSMSTTQLRDAVAGVVETAATGNFPGEQLRGSTFTLNNYGGFGVDGSAPIINQPEVAMLGIGRIMDRPWVVDGELAVRKVGVLSMVFDHRVCDGDVPSGFITFVAACIENPLHLLGEV